MQVIEPNLTISPSTIPNAVAGVPYSQNLHVNAPDDSVTWSNASPLPQGFVLTGSGKDATLSCQNPIAPFNAEVIIVATNGVNIGVAKY